MSNNSVVYWGTGRRKTSVARVRLVPGNGTITINGRPGQSGAIKQGAARALCELSADNRKPLKTEGHLSRDPRAKERRKYGLKKARKAPQFSKR